MTVPGATTNSLTTRCDACVIAVHGGAGTLRPGQMRPDLAHRYRAGIAAALAAGHRLLCAGAPATDAVVAAVAALEDDPFFNAGRGSVFNDQGRIEMDATVMDGHRGQGGGVAAVTSIRNPVRAARAVMDHTAHVLLGGPAAEAFAAAQGLALEDAGYFFTSHRWEQWQQARGLGRILRDHDAAEAGPGPDSPVGPPPDSTRMGTVGAVARDAAGHLAAATSTGGLTNKMSGRIGDSAQLGAGTFADAVVAVSGTGTGEFFMRGLPAFDVSARMRLLGLPLGTAVDQAIQAALSGRGGGGGLIAVDAGGAVHLAFNTTGMYRGWMGRDGVARVGIFTGPETPVLSTD